MEKNNWILCHWSVSLWTVVYNWWWGVICVKISTIWWQRIERNGPSKEYRVKRTSKSKATKSTKMSATNLPAERKLFDRFFDGNRIELPATRDNWGVIWLQAQGCRGETFLVWVCVCVLQRRAFVPFSRLEMRSCTFMLFLIVIMKDRVWFRLGWRVGCPSNCPNLHLQPCYH